MKNKLQVNVDNYYVDKLTRGHDTRICSILLENVSREGHEGNWVCSNKISDNLKKSIQSNVAKVKVLVTDSENRDMSENSNKVENESVSTATSTGYIVGISLLMLAIVALITGIILYYFRMKINQNRAIRRIALKIMREPESSIVVYLGNTLLLNCEFNTNVNCSWMKNGLQEEVDDYFYDQSTKGFNAKECSLLLKNASKEAYEGNWTCSNKVDDAINKRVELKILNTNECVSTDSSTGYAVTITVLVLIIIAFIGFTVYTSRSKQPKYKWMESKSDEGHERDI
ncbi:hypothetical protein CHUAL_006175 [Chamberlinius hualienensis]